jgi:hypothetical protein
MVGDGLFHVTVTFALVTGTAAGVLSLLTWEVFRRSVFGRVIFVFSVVMSLFIIYHVLLLVLGESNGFLAVLDSVLYTGLVAFIIMVIHVERQFSDKPTQEVRRPWR